MGARVRGLTVVAAIFSLLPACDRIVDQNSGPPEKWRFDAVAPGDTLVLPRNPCPPGTDSVARVLDRDEQYELELGRAAADDPDTLKLTLPRDLPPGRYNYSYICMSPVSILLRLSWEVQVTSE
jgi:hypothetical protein